MVGCESTFRDVKLLGLTFIKHEVDYMSKLVNDASSTTSSVRSCNEEQLRSMLQFFMSIAEDVHELCNLMCEMEMESNAVNYTRRPIPNNILRKAIMQSMQMSLIDSTTPPPKGIIMCSSLPNTLGNLK